MNSDGPELSDLRGTIDTNCYVGNWPTRPLPFNEPASLRRVSMENSVGTCLVSSLGAIFHRDYMAANRALERSASGIEGLIPVPVVNPTNPPLGPTHPIIRMVPSHHRYRLSDSRTRKLLDSAESENQLVFISTRMRDRRLLDPSFRILGTEVEGIIDAATSHPDLSLVVNNAKAAEVEKILSRTDNVLVGCEWSFPIGFIRRMVGDHGDSRLVFGSNAPLHYYKSSLLQVEKADIPPASRRRILGGNISRLLSSLD